MKNLLLLGRHVNYWGSCTAGFAFWLGWITGLATSELTLATGMYKCHNPSSIHCLSKVSNVNVLHVESHFYCQQENSGVGGSVSPHQSTSAPAALPPPPPSLEFYLPAKRNIVYFWMSTFLFHPFFGISACSDKHRFHIVLWYNQDSSVAKMTSVLWKTFLLVVLQQRNTANIN